MKKVYNNPRPRQTARCRTASQWLALLLTGALTLSLAACGNSVPPSASTAPQAPSAASETLSGKATAPSDKPLVSVLHMYSGMPRDGADGFYLAETPYFDEQKYLMFYDYNTLEQRFVCTVAGCAHSGKDCGAFLTEGYVVPFVAGDKLYCAYGNQLEQRELDGTKPRVLATTTKPKHAGFGRNSIYTDGEALYTVCGTPAEQEIVCVDMATGETMSIPVPDIEQRVWDGGCFGRTILSIEREQEQTVKTPITLYATNVDDGTQTVLRRFEAGIQPCITIYNEQQDGKLYGVNVETGEIVLYDLATDTLTTVTDAFAKYAPPIPREIPPEMANADPKPEAMFYPAANWVGVLADGWLYLYLTDEAAQVPVGVAKEEMKLAYNLQTGEIKRVTLTDAWNGAEQPMMMHTQTPHGLLVTQEHRLLTGGAIGYDGKIQEYPYDYQVYALMNPEDYRNSTPNFRTIQPVKYGSDNAVTGAA